MKKDGNDHNKMPPALQIVRVGLLLGALALLIYAVSTVPGKTEGLRWLIFLALMVAGLVISLALTRYHDGRPPAWVKGLCKKRRFTDCDVILGTWAADIGGISTAQAGLWYYAGSITALVLGAIVLEPATILLPVSITVLLAIPYDLFALGYMVFKLPRMCPLCLIIHTIMFFLAGWILISWPEGNWTLEAIAVAGASYILTGPLLLAKAEDI